MLIFFLICLFLQDNELWVYSFVEVYDMMTAKTNSNLLETGATTTTTTTTTTTATPTTADTFETAQE